MEIDCRPAPVPIRKKKVTYLGTLTTDAPKEPHKILESLQAQVEEIAAKSKELQEAQKMLESRVDDLKSTILQSIED